MGTIRHVCAGHEYRYDTYTGQVRNNYGAHVSTLVLCESGYALLYRAEDTKHLDLLASAPGGHKASNETLAEFAIGQTAVVIPEV